MPDKGSEDVVASGGRMRFLLTALGALVATGQVQASDSMDAKCRDFRPSISRKTQLERPQPPMCVQGMLYNDAFSRERCEREIKSYRQEVEKFIECLGDEHERAVEEFNAAIQRYNIQSQILRK